MDITFIRGLEIDTVIGIYDWERKIRQAVVLDIEMGCSVKQAAATDAIADAVDYEAISKRLLQYVRESRFQLVESLAEGIAGVLRNEFGVRWLRLTLSKREAVAEARGDVGVIIERGERY